MTGKEISEMQTKYVLQGWSKQGGLNPTPVDHCEGIYIYDKDGKRYADMSSEQVNVNAGYANKEMTEAIKAQLDEYAYIQGSFGAEPRALLAKSIVDRLPDCFGKIFFTNGGADANENAIKIARMYTGRFKVMSQYRSYHGSTFGAGNLTGEPRHFALEPAIPGFIHFRGPYSYQEKIKFASEEEEGDYYVEKLREQVIFEGGDRIAAIILETVVGSNGIIIYPKNYLKGVRKICDEFGIMMICDEVMAGWYRTGKMFAYMNFDVVPDIITFAKGVNSGYIPLGGAIVKNEIAHFFDDKYLSCGLTYSGHPLACAAGVACQEFYLKNDIEGHVQKVGKHLGEVLENLKAKHKSVGDVRYIGLFGGVELVKDRATHEPLVPWGQDPAGVMGAIVKELKAREFVTYSHENVIIVAPPLIITEAQIDEELAKLDEVLSIVDEKYI
ncbi:MAG: aminotransferase class III-fold pyridoxal phosphate-dependent enzyme [Treponema porcinum]|uniref:aminotransferase class III-fold pyridoxal phosphate-dependent enzyme n=1 Tax=Treponema porcinum TaxID=261392 RepID=UPI0023523EB3|nr:aminotransferase class III-fold pyridoxal phosphate-dependent enzyme [Treponema porcinum]MCI6984316.1 aminotransferase class III-fold pyridoxal phosphate-dependent enzyme [Treponema porcinum]MCI7534087.1 aminotransferase class III-fold pyridoxal phosphate-dependent enzyme [Treponema porcinum]